MSKRVSKGLKIDPDLWKEVKRQAVEDETTISEWVEEAIEKRLERRSKEGSF